MSTEDPKIALLRSVPALSHYRDKDLARIAPLVDEIESGPGDVLMEEARPGLSAYLIVEGTASVTLKGKAVAELGPGEFVGEMALLDHSPRSATVTAQTPMRLLAMNPRSFASLLNQPSVRWRIAADLAKRLRRAESAPSYAEVER